MTEGGTRACPRRAGPVWKSTSVSGAPDNSSRSHFSAMTRSCWPRRAVRNRHRHAIEQAACRWRGGEDDAMIQYERAVNSISTQVQAGLRHDPDSKPLRTQYDGLKELKRRVESIDKQLKKGMALKVRSRRPAVLRCLHSIDATRVHLTMKWTDLTEMLRAGSRRRSSPSSRRRRR